MIISSGKLYHKSARSASNPQLREALAHFKRRGGRLCPPAECSAFLRKSTAKLHAPKPPLVMPHMIRGGGICEANDGGDLLQVSEHAEICSVRIPSDPSGQRPYPYWPFGPFPSDRGNRPLSGEPWGCCISAIFILDIQKPAHPSGCAGCQQKIIHKNGPDELTFRTKADRM